MPFVPAKTLTGIWRDACEQVAGWWCGPPEQVGAWWAWVDWLFGSQPPRQGDRVWSRQGAPQPAALRVSPARLPEQVCTAARTRPAAGRGGGRAETWSRARRRHRDCSRGSAAGRGAGPTGGAAGPGRARRRRPGGRRHRPRGRARQRAVLARGCRAAAARRCSRDRRHRRQAEPGCGPVLAAAARQRRRTVDVAAAEAAAALPAPATPRPVDSRLLELLDRDGVLDAPGPSGPPQPCGTRVAGPGWRHGATRRRPRVSRRIVVEVVSPLVAQYRVVGNVILSRDHVPGTALLPAVSLG